MKRIEALLCATGMLLLVVGLIGLVYVDSPFTVMLLLLVGLMAIGFEHALITRCVYGDKKF